MKNEALIPLFASLVSKFGKDNELHTFDACSNYGVELADSTIDKIELIFGFDDITNVMFYFNENNGDCSGIDSFKEDDLLDFYKEIKKALNASHNEETIFAITNGILQRLFESYDAERITENILEDVIADIKETADEDFNDVDIEIAVQRVLLDRLGI